MPLKRSISDKRERFVAEYLVDLNATQAAVRAGYKGRNVGGTAKRLMQNPEVLALISKAKEKRLGRIGITQERVLGELELIAFSDLTHYKVDDAGDVGLAEGAPEGAIRALQSIRHKTITTGSGENARTVHEVELKLWDKTAALAKAGRHVDVHGFWDRMEHTGPNGGDLPAVTLYQIPANGREAK